MLPAVLQMYPPAYVWKVRNHCQDSVSLFDHCWINVWDVNHDFWYFGKASVQSATTIFTVPASMKGSYWALCTYVNAPNNYALLFPYNKPTRCTNFANLFWKWNSTCFRQFLCPSSGVIHYTLSNGICHTRLQTAFEQDQDGSQFHPDPARKLLANLYDIYHCWVYSE